MEKYMSGSVSLCQHGLWQKIWMGCSLYPLLHEGGYSVSLLYEIIEGVCYSDAMIPGEPYELGWKRSRKCLGFKSHWKGNWCNKEKIWAISSLWWCVSPYIWQLAHWQRQFNHGLLYIPHERNVPSFLVSTESRKPPWHKVNHPQSLKLAASWLLSTLTRQKIFLRNQAFVRDSL